MPHFFERQKHTIQMLLKLAARVTVFIISYSSSNYIYIDMEHVNDLFLQGKNNFPNGMYPL